MAKLLSGKELSYEILEDLKDKIADFRIKPSMAVIMIGLDLESEGYQKFLEKARDMKINVETFALEEDTAQEEVLTLIEKLNNNKKIHGILLQLPVPEDMDENKLIDFIDPEKDIEGFSPENLGWLSLGEPKVIPSTSQAILKLLENTRISIVSKQVCILGDNNFLARPLAQTFLSLGASVSVIDKIKEAVTQKADILICNLDDPNVIKKEMVKKNAVVIDVMGDVDFDDVKKQASYITPWPEGVDSLMTAALLTNAWKAMLRVEGYEDEGDIS
ncbi:MAG: tetrahydrofolate dehydrogenase/cyclohydrolase catalytic domain-containing protein [Patescibacteria group bacterium]